jgi:hypothetical protein
MPLAVSTGIQIAYVVALVVVPILGPLTIAELKDGDGLLIGAGWSTLGITWWVAAFRLAKPGSWWARHLYGPRKLERAEARWAEVEAE